MEAERSNKFSSKHLHVYHRDGHAGFGLRVIRSRGACNTQRHRLYCYPKVAVILGQLDRIDRRRTRNGPLGPGPAVINVGNTEDLPGVTNEGPSSKKGPGKLSGTLASITKQYRTRTLLTRSRETVISTIAEIYSAVMMVCSLLSGTSATGRSAWIPEMERLDGMASSRGRNIVLHQATRTCSTSLPTESISSYRSLGLPARHSTRGSRRRRIISGTTGVPLAIASCINVALRTCAWVRSAVEIVGNILRSRSY